MSRLHAPATLSPREVEVPRLVSTGNTNAEIGRALYISEESRKTMSKIRQAAKLPLPHQVVVHPGLVGRWCPRGLLDQDAADRLVS
jgi:hypothetical protein